MPGPSVFKDSLRTLNWAVYLGCSWTWCIGMFLPVILVSEFGNAAWFVFAIPNVLGAAAMGWTLAKPKASEKIVAEHRIACVAFSAITLAFHLFFLYWLTHVGLMSADVAMAAIFLGITFGFIGRQRVQIDFLLGWIVLCISLAVLARGLVHPVMGVAHPLEASRSGWSLTGLAPICIFGFLLCPYLDVTFHRARQQTPVAMGKWAFAVGFSVVFLTMIVLTLLYAGDFALDKQQGDRFGSFGGALLMTWVAVHIASQAGLTLALHLRALPKPRINDLFLWGIAGLLVWSAMFAVQQEMWFSVRRVGLTMLSGELMYRLFLSFYGLVFPGYVWICMVPLRGRSPGPSPVALAVLSVAALMAAPLFWAGFIAEKMLWLIPGVCLILIARFIVPDRQPLSTSAVLERVVERA